MDPQWGINAQCQPGQCQLFVRSRAAAAGARAVPTSHRGNTQIWLHCPPFPFLLCASGRMIPQNMGIPSCQEGLTLSSEMVLVASLLTQELMGKQRQGLSPQGDLVVEDRCSCHKCGFAFLLIDTFNLQGPWSTEFFIHYGLCAM